VSESRFGITITATAEVRDAEGNLISAEPVEAYMELTRAELEERGWPIPEETEA